MPQAMLFEVRSCLTALAVWVATQQMILKRFIPKEVVPLDLIPDVEAVEVLVVGERDLIAERQNEGIEKAKNKGVRFGRQNKLTPAQVEELRAAHRAGESRIAGGGFAPRSAASRSAAHWRLR